MPPIMDLPNHLARIWLIAGGAAELPLAEIYKIDFAKAGGNVGVDLIAATLARTVPILWVSKFLIALAFLGPPLGGVVLNRALVHKFHPYQMTFLTLAWSTTAIAGFVNFQISLGAALFGVAIVAAKSDGLSKPNFLLHLTISSILILIHPLGLGFYAAAMFGLQIGPELRSKFAYTAARDVLRRLAGILCGVMAPVVFMRLVFSGVPGTAPPRPFWGDPANIVDPIHILTILFSPVLSYNLVGDILTSLPIAALVLCTLIGRRLRVHAGLALVAGVLFVLSPVAPDAFGDGSWLPQRFPIMAALLFLAALRPQNSADVFSRKWLPIALPLLALSRTLWITWVWMSRQGDIAALDETMNSIAPGSSVVTLQQETRDWRLAPTGRYMIGSPNGVRATGRHLGGLVVIDRHAFIPTLFSVPGQHALEIAPGWRRKAVIASSIPYPRQLGATVSGDPYLKTWRANFDYVLVLNADLASISSFDRVALTHLEAVADHGFARLYKVGGRQFGGREPLTW